MQLQTPDFKRHISTLRATLGTQRAARRAPWRQIGGGMIAGILADATGNYRAGFTVVSLLAGFGSVFFLLARRPAPRLRASG